MISPCFHSTRVGTDCILYSEDKEIFLSISIFSIMILFPIFFFNSSRTGFIILQGPHHSAKKSTRTGGITCDNILKFVHVLKFNKMNMILTAVWLCWFDSFREYQKILLSRQSTNQFPLRLTKVRLIFRMSLCLCEKNNFPCMNRVSCEVFISE